MSTAGWRVSRESRGGAVVAAVTRASQAHATTRTGLMLLMRLLYCFQQVIPSNFDEHGQTELFYLFFGILHTVCYGFNLIFIQFGCVLRNSESFLFPYILFWRLVAAVWLLCFQVMSLHVLNMMLNYSLVFLYEKNYANFLVPVLLILYLN